MVKKILSGLLALLVIGVFVLLATGCAPTDTSSSSSKETSELNSGVITKHLSTSIVYTLDYVEYTTTGYGCFVYDGSDSGNLYCFKLGE